jgi:hypothetical protein
VTMNYLELFEALEGSESREAVMVEGVAHCQSAAPLTSRQSLLPTYLSVKTSPRTRTSPPFYLIVMLAMKRAIVTSSVKLAANIRTSGMSILTGNRARP